MNKGHEAMAYLTYIVDNYEKLPSTMAFLHAHRAGFFEAWHVDTPLHDNVVAITNLQLDYIAENGYVNLRCNWNPGCMKKQRLRNPHVTGDVWEQVFNDTSSDPALAKDRQGNPIEPLSYRQDRQRALLIGLEVAATCCAQFAVSRDQVLSRPLDDYQKFRQWVIDTAMDDRHSGRVMEYLWHVIFGKEAI